MTSPNTCDPATPPPRKGTAHTLVERTQRDTGTSGTSRHPARSTIYAKPPTTSQHSLSTQCMLTILTVRRRSDPSEDEHSPAPVDHPARRRRPSTAVGGRAVPPTVTALTAPPSCRTGACITSAPGRLRTPTARRGLTCHSRTNQGAQPEEGDTSVRRNDRQDDETAHQNSRRPAHPPTSATRTYSVLAMGGHQDSVRELDVARGVGSRGSGGEQVGAVDEDRRGSRERQVSRRFGVEVSV